MVLIPNASLKMTTGSLCRVTGAALGENLASIEFRARAENGNRIICCQKRLFLGLSKSSSFTFSLSEAHSLFLTFFLFLFQCITVGPFYEKMAEAKAGCKEQEQNSTQEILA